MLEETYLNTFEVIHTYGFLKIISILYFPAILTAMGLYINNKLKGDK